MMIKPISYEHFLRLCSIKAPTIPNQRTGQKLFNLLCDYRPDLAEQIRATDNDPFYDDSKVVDCLVYLMENWD